MTKRAFLAVAGLLPVLLSSTALAQPGIFRSLNSSVTRVPSLALTQTAMFSFATAFDFAGTPPSDFLPLLGSITQARPSRTSAHGAATDLSKDSSKEVVELKRTNFFDYATGEVGFLYGKSFGKYGVESEQGYIIGEVGNEHLHISAGASYENLSGRFPRSVR